MYYVLFKIDNDVKEVRDEVFYKLTEVVMFSGRFQERKFGFRVSRRESERIKVQINSV